MMQNGSNFMYCQSLKINLVKLWGNHFFCLCVLFFTLCFPALLGILVDLTYIVFKGS